MFFRASIVLLFAISLLQQVSADVSVTSPTDGASFSASGGTVSVPISWTDDVDDSSDTFSLSNVQSYTVLICYGSAASIKCATNQPLLAQKTEPSKKFTADIPSSSYPNGFYFFQIYTVFKDKSTTIHYTGRVKLSGMTGPTTIDASNDGDTPLAQTSEAGGANGGTIKSEWFTIPYTLQTGKTRYAPMQTQPGSEITATTWNRRFPTSAVTYYTSASPSPNVHSTITPGWNYTAISAVNWATPAPYPTYFYPASERVSKAKLKTAKKKRWDE